MSRYFLKLAYDGTQYHGWQIQPNGITVQEVLESKLFQITRIQMPLTGCGRTDTGVHAKKFYAHFDFGEMDLPEMDKLKFRLNAVLPDDIVINDIFRVSDDANARFDAISRTYRYYYSLKKNPFLQKYSTQLFALPDVELMNEGALLLKKYIDFTSFSKVHTDTATNNCKISDALWQHDGDQLIFTIRADRFLRNMVRAIVGTLIDLGFKKISISDLKMIVELKNRNHAGNSVPARGLFLEDVEYPQTLFI